MLGNWGLTFAAASCSTEFRPFSLAMEIIKFFLGPQRDEDEEESDEEVEEEEDDEEGLPGEVRRDNFHPN